MRYPWNFIFHRCFLRKSTPKHAVGLEARKFSDSLPKVNFPGEEIAEPAVEAISLDMKQQELDGRYCRCTKKLLWSVISYYITFLFFLSYYICIFFV